MSLLDSWLLFLLICNQLLSVVSDSPEGCSKGWSYFNQRCYFYSPHSLDAVAAKEVCGTYKHSSLASVWDDAEAQFITSTLIPPGYKDMVWVGLVPRNNKDQGWAWLDGSIPDIHIDGTKPKSNKDMCGALSMEGLMVFKNCWEPLPGFVCKASLEMTYMISNLVNTTTKPGEPPKILFERVWPPKLYDLPQYVEHIAHTQVPAAAHETDCAFYCSHVTNCKAFVIQCLLAWKCKVYTCELYKAK